MLEAVEWNLLGYAQEAITKLEELENPTEFAAFMALVEAKKREAEEVVWE